jgi:very-short-patch-repair endonuclease
MAQPIPKTRPKTKAQKKKTTTSKRPHPKYGTSKLEDYFARNFLDQLGVKYIRQFEAKDIGRFYDFFCPDANVIIEVDGDYYHSYGLTHEQKNPMQKHNEWVDKVKDEWALLHGIPILRIWEHDIHDNPNKVMMTLKESIGKYTEKKKKKDAKGKRH